MEPGRVAVAEHVGARARLEQSEEEDEHGELEAEACPAAAAHGGVHRGGGAQGGVPAAEEVRRGGAPCGVPAAIGSRSAARMAGAATGELGPTAGMAGSAARRGRDASVGGNGHRGTH